MAGLRCVALVVIFVAAVCFGQSSTQVNFDARYLHPSALRPMQGRPLIVTTVLVNEGNAYDNLTGYFTAPYAGTYSFVGKTGFTSSDGFDFFYLQVDDTTIDWARSDYYGPGAKVGMVYGTVHLRAGQRVFLKSYGNTYDSVLTRFSGYLVSLD